MNNRDLRISTHDHPLMSLKNGSKLLEEMSPFNNRKSGPHGESLETRGIMETVSCRCFNYSSFSSLKFKIKTCLFHFHPSSPFAMSN